MNELFLNHNSSDRFIKVKSINLSWMSFSIILRIFYLPLRKKLIVFKCFNFLRQNDYIKVDFSEYSFFNKILDKLLFKIFHH